MDELEKIEREFDRDVKKAEIDLARDLNKAKAAELLEVVNALPDTPRAMVKSAAAGAMVGSVIPVIGTGIGAVIGGVAGLAWRLKNK